MLINLSRILLIAFCSLIEPCNACIDTPETTALNLSAHEDEKAFLYDWKYLKTFAGVKFYWSHGYMKSSISIKAVNTNKKEVTITIKASGCEEETKMTFYAVKPSKDSRNVLCSSMRNYHYKSITDISIEFVEIDVEDADVLSQTYNLSNSTVSEYKEIMTEYNDMKIGEAILGIAVFLDIYESNPIEGTVSIVISESDWSLYVNAVSGYESFVHQRMTSVCGANALNKSVSKNASDRKFWEKLYKYHNNNR